MSVRPSIRLSVCLSRYFVETAQHVIELFSQSGSYITLVFAVPNVTIIFRLGPLTGASNAVLVQKLAIFDQYLGISQK